MLFLTKFFNIKFPVEDGDNNINLEIFLLLVIFNVEF